MRQFILPGGWKGEPECLVTGREARQLLRVLRLGLGDSLPALDAAGRRYVCEIVAVDEGSLRLAITPSARAEAAAMPDLRGKSAPRSAALEDAGASDAQTESVWEAPEASLPRLILAAALLKGEKFDLVIRQATEAGVSRILPFTSARSLGLAEGEGRRLRQERIIREALQQSGSSVPTRLEPVSRLDALPDRLGMANEKRLCLLLHEAPLAEASLHRYLGDAVDEIVVCVGPEGGFSPEEVVFLRGRGFLPVRLPGAVLRAETAALFALAAVETIYSERESWIPETD